MRNVYVLHLVRDLSGVCERCGDSMRVPFPVWKRLRGLSAAEKIIDRLPPVRGSISLSSSGWPHVYVESAKSFKYLTNKYRKPSADAGPESRYHACGTPSAHVVEVHET